MLGEPQHLDRTTSSARGPWSGGRATAARRRGAGALGAPEGAPRLRRHAASRFRSTPTWSRRRAAASSRRRWRRSCTTASSVAYADGRRTRACGSISSPALARISVFTRRSGTPLSTPIPPLYTRDVFKQHHEGRPRGAREAVARRTPGSGATTRGSSLANAGHARLGGHRPVRAGLHPRVGRAAGRPAVRPVHDDPADRCGAADPDRADLAAARPAARRRRQHDARRQPIRVGSPGLLDRTKKRVTDIADGVLKPIEKAAGLPPVEPGTARHGAFPVGPPADGRRSPARRSWTASSKTIGDIQQQLDTLGPDVAGASPVEILSEPVVPARSRRRCDEQTAGAARRAAHARLADCRRARERRRRWRHRTDRVAV